MINSLVCGSSNLPKEEPDIDELLSPCSKSTLKKFKKSKADHTKNPYANRGLDKFNALLDELETKKQKIYTQKGSQDISFIRFVYSSSNDWKPIVVKAKERRRDQNLMKNKSNDKDMVRGFSAPIGKLVQENKGKKILIQRNRSKEFARSRLSFKMGNLRQPFWYMPVMIILILLFLTIHGRTFAIICSSIGWYVIPIIKDSSLGSNSNSKSSVEKSKNQKKDYDRNFSERNMVSEEFSSSKKKDSDGKFTERSMVPKESTSPKSVLSGPAENSSSRHAHRKSW